MNEMKKILIYIILLYITLLTGVGCTHAVHLYHVSELEAQFNRKKLAEISSESTQFTVMGFIQNTDYVNQAFEDLKGQCLKGNVVGINTRYSTSHGFFSWTNKIKMTAYCVN